MWTPFLARNDSNQRTPHAHGQSDCVHTSAVMSTILHGAKSQSTTVNDATRFKSIPTSVHKYPRSVTCQTPRCPNTISPQSVPDEIQRIATKHAFQRHKVRREKCETYNPHPAVLELMTCDGHQAALAFFVWWEIPVVCATLQISCHNALLVQSRCLSLFVERNTTKIAPSRSSFGDGLRRKSAANLANFWRDGIHCNCLPGNICNFSISTHRERICHEHRERTTYCYMRVHQNGTKIEIQNGSSCRRHTSNASSRK